MSNLLAIDPSTTCTGIAVFGGDSKLLLAAAIEPSSLAESWEYRIDSMMRQIRIAIKRYAIDKCALELPKVYNWESSKADPADIVKVAVACGAYAAMIGTLYSIIPTYYEPNQWKGSLTKEQMCNRVRSLLSPSELDKVKARIKTLEHNALDAAGIGMFQLGRLRKVRVL